MRSGRGTVAVLLAGLLIVGPLTACESTDAEAEAEVEGPTATELGELGGRIYLDPDRAEEILAEVDLSRETFAVHVRNISADPERTREYSEAFEAIAGDTAPASAEVPDSGEPGTDATG